MTARASFQRGPPLSLERGDHPQGCFRWIGGRSWYVRPSVRDHVAAEHRNIAGASAILLLSSVPRVAKGPVPAVLTVTSAVSSYYYGSTVYSLRSGA